MSIVRLRRTLGRLHVCGSSSGAIGHRSARHPKIKADGAFHAQIIDFALRYEDNALLPRTCVISIKELSKNKACVEALIGRGLVQVDEARTCLEPCSSSCFHLHLLPHLAWLSRQECSAARLVHWLALGSRPSCVPSVISLTAPCPLVSPLCLPHSHRVLDSRR